MNNESNSNEQGKSISKFQNDAVNGETIIGGASKIIMPTLEDDGNGINNSGFSPEKGEGPIFKDDGTSSPVNSDGTIG